MRNMLKNFSFFTLLSISPALAAQNVQQPEQDFPAAAGPQNEEHGIQAAAAPNQNEIMHIEEEGAEGGNGEEPELWHQNVIRFEPMNIEINAQGAGPEVRINGVPILRHLNLRDQRFRRDH